jgi:hypothetical protein
VQLGDLNGDGWSEIVLVGKGQSGAELLVLWNLQGNFNQANFTSLELSSDTSAFLLMNLDEDAALEVLVAAGPRLLAFNVVDAQLEDMDLTIDRDENPIGSMASADLNGDGLPDLLLGQLEDMTFFRSIPRNEAP